jgi:hypothetical protein
MNSKALGELKNAVNVDNYSFGEQITLIKNGCGMNSKASGEQKNAVKLSPLANSRETL